MTFVYLFHAATEGGVGAPAKDFAPLHEDFTSPVDEKRGIIP